MDIVKVREDIIKAARYHKKPDLRPVRLEEFEDLSGKEFVDKAYCRLLGRLPGVEEKDQLYLRFYSGDVSKLDLLEELGCSRESYQYGVNALDILNSYDVIKRTEKEENTLFRRIGKGCSLLGYLFTHKKAWSRLARVREIWKQLDEEERQEKARRAEAAKQEGMA